MRHNQRVRDASCVCAMARPGILRRTFNHPCTHWIELDIAHAGQEVPLAINQGRPVSPFPQGPGALIERLHHDCCHAE